MWLKGLVCFILKIWNTSYIINIIEEMASVSVTVTTTKNFVNDFWKVLICLYFELNLIDNKHGSKIFLQKRCFSEFV